MNYVFFYFCDGGVCNSCIFKIKNFFYKYSVVVIYNSLNVMLDYIL